jgi:hypothetical protein
LNKGGSNEQVCKSLKVKLIESQEQNTFLQAQNEALQEQNEALQIKLNSQSSPAMVRKGISYADAVSPPQHTITQRNKQTNNSFAFTSENSQKRFPTEKEWPEVKGNAMYSSKK